MNVERAKHLYVVEKLSLTKVADRLGESSNTVRAALIAEGVELRRSGAHSTPPWNEQQRNLAKHLYVTENMSLVDVGKALGCPAYIARRRLEEMGVPIRGVGMPRDLSIWPRAHMPTSAVILARLMMGESIRVLCNYLGIKHHGLYQHIHHAEDRLGVAGVRHCTLEAIRRGWFRYHELGTAGPDIATEHPLTLDLFRHLESQ